MDADHVLNINCDYQLQIVKISKKFWIKLYKKFSEKK